MTEEWNDLRFFDGKVRIQQRGEFGHHIRRDVGIRSDVSECSIPSIE